MISRKLAYQFIANDCWEGPSQEIDLCKVLIVKRIARMHVQNPRLELGVKFTWPREGLVLFARIDEVASVKVTDIQREPIKVPGHV